MHFDIAEASLTDMTSASVVSFAVSKAPMGFNLADVSVGATLSQLMPMSPLFYTATASATGTAAITVPAGRFTDAAGDPNPLSGTDITTLDTRPPAAPPPHYAFVGLTVSDGRVTENAPESAVVAQLARVDADVGDILRYTLAVPSGLPPRRRPDPRSTRRPPRLQGDHLPQRRRHRARSGRRQLQPRPHP